MSNITIDERRHPLIHITLLDTQNDADLQKNISLYRRLFIKNEPFVIMIAVVGGRHAMRGPQGKRLKAFVDEHREDFSRLCLGIAYIFDSIILRMALRSLSMVIKFPCPFHVSPDADGALQWCQSKLPTADISLP